MVQSAALSLNSDLFYANIQNYDKITNTDEGQLMVHTECKWYINLDEYTINFKKYTTYIQYGEYTNSDHISSLILSYKRLVPYVDYNMY